MDRTNARAGQHGHGRVGNHRQVDGDAIAFLDAEAAQRIAELAHAFVQFAVGHRIRRTVRAIGFEQDRGLVATRGQLPVQAIHAGIQDAVGIPVDAEVFQRVADILDAGRLADPVKAFGGLAPEFFRLLDGFTIRALVGIAVDARLRGEFRFYWIEIRHGALPATIDVSR